MVDAVQKDPAPEKRSSAPWKPRSSRLEVRSKEPGYRYKWASVAATEDRIEELREEGWEPATRVTGDTKRGDTSPGSASRVGTLRLMKIPEELAESRDAHFQRETDRQTMRPAQRAVAMLDQAGGPYNSENVITDELINPNTNRPFEDVRAARAFMAQRMKAQRYPTTARRNRQPGIG
jgi:hypothetical protein